MILFQAQIEEHQKLAEHYRELAAKREALAESLLAFQQQADSDLSSLRLLVDKCKEVAPNAIASLKSAVLTLFDENGDDGNEGGNQLHVPTTGPEDRGTELPGLNGQTCDIDYSPLQGQVCEWVCPLASSLCSLAWEDAPLLGQACAWASPFASPLACAVEFPQFETKKPAYTEFVEVSVSVGYFKVQHSGEIKAAYAGFTQKQRAESWGKWLAVRHEVASGFEVRLAKHLPFKWELKLWGLNINQINRLAKEDLTSSPHTEVDSAKPPSYKKPQSAKPVNPDDIATGDIVTPLLSPSDSYEVIQIMPNGILDCKSLRTGVNMGMRKSAVSLLQKAEKTEHGPTTQSAEIQFNDLVEVVADANDTVGLVGTFGRVKTIKGSRIGVEIDEQLTYFDSKELKVKASAEAAPQPTGLQSGQLLMGNRIVTTGNYTGLARRSSILNTRMGTADKVAALELVKGGLSPELALVTATGTADTDYDF